MRIVYVLTTLAVGGTERQVLAIASRMAVRGHSVALVVIKPPCSGEFATALEVFHLNVGKSFFGVAAGIWRGVQFLRGFRPDLVHSHNFHGNMFARIMRLFHPNARLVSTIHNVYEGGRVRMLAYRCSRGLPDRTTAVSRAVADRFLRLKAVRADTTIVITNGIEIADFMPDPERRAAMRFQMSVTDEFVWLTVGRNTSAKDWPNLLQAFGQTWRSEPAMHLWLAGDRPATPGRKAVYRVISGPHGALDCVLWLGARNDIAALLDAADGFVLASAWEGMPLALGEAMAMGKPVVATDVGGVRELVGDAGVLVPAKDPDALAEAMLSVMRKSSADRVQMGRAARARIVTNFDIDAKADEWEALYASMLA